MAQNRKKIDDYTLMKLKLEAVEELDLADKVKELGWGGLTSEETGKMGGYITKKIHMINNIEEEE
ncbi:MAG: small, acid-soluble spore protein, alpha/beta type [Halanaerobiales bacterium]